MSHILTASAFADPLKIESENIVLYGDVDAKAAQAIVRDLEIYRRTIFAMVDKTPVPAEVKLTIYSFNSSKPLSKFFGNKMTAGLYTNGANGPIFVTSIKKTHREDTLEELVAKHEFSHHVLHAIVEDDFPRWYDEGFANYLSTFDVKGNVITIGAPKIGHGQALQRGRLMAVEDVLRSIRLYPWAKRGEGGSNLVNQFYAQSWLYVHYMQNHTEYGSALPDYLARLKKGGDPLQAFEGAFGISPKDFHNKTKKYFAADAFPVLQFKAEPVFLAVDMTTETIGDAELHLEILTGQSNILNDDNRGDYRKRLDKAESGLGLVPRITIARARLAVADEDYDTAVEMAQKAYEVDRNDMASLRILGDAYAGRSQAARFDALKATDLHVYLDNADLQTALSHYRTVLAKSPRDRNVVRSIVHIYGHSDMEITEDVLSATQFYENSLFDTRSAHAMLNLANIHARSGKVDRACSYAAIAKGQAGAVKSRNKTDLKARLAAFDATHGGACSG